MRTKLRLALKIQCLTIAGLEGLMGPDLQSGPGLSALMSSKFDQADPGRSAFSFLPRFNLL